MLRLGTFTSNDFDTLISWIDSKELLVTIAGTVFEYPLTHTQLQEYIDDKKSLAFTVIDDANERTIGHAEIRLSGDGTCKLDKVLIGDKADRGHGVGLELINLLLDYSFTKLGVSLFELNVYDWNIAGRKCYEKAGFKINPEKKQLTKIGDINWEASNMIIEKDRWSVRVNS